MKLNVGFFDSRVRLVLGIVILLVHYVYYIVTDYYFVWANIGWILVITGYLRRCPLYLPFKINTNKEK